MGRKRLAKNKGFPPNLYENSAGYFYFIDPESKKSKGLGRDRAKAFVEARAGNAAVANRKPSTLVDWLTGRQDYTLAEWVPLYKAMWITETGPADNTIRNATGYLNKIAAADFAWRKMRDIETAHIAAFLKVFEKSTGAPSATGLRSRLRDVFRMAETQGLIDVAKNPVAATYAPSRAVRRERLTLEQFHLVRAQAPDWLKKAMMLALVTAQRREDVANMKFADQRDGYLFIVQGKSQGEIKLQQDINIRLTKVGFSIGDVIQQCRDLVVSRYMIHHTAHRSRARPGDPLSINGISNAFQEAVSEAGIVAADGRTAPTFHEIRSLAERLYKEEFGAEFAQAMLGHKNASMTAKYDDMRGTGFKIITAR